MSGGKPVAVEGTDLPLWGMEIDADEAAAEWRLDSANKNTGMRDAARVRDASAACLCAASVSLSLRLCDKTRVINAFMNMYN